MGMDLNYLKLFKTTVETHCDKNINKKLIALGYPDLLATKKTLIEVFGKKLVSGLSIDKFENDIQKWHKWNEPVYNVFDLFSYYRFIPTVLDIESHRGVETIVDLNEHLPLDLKNQFDFLVDTGTLEHCFNVGQAFKNMCDLINLGGIIITAAPISKLNHGFYNFCPILYNKGFSENGFEILSMNLIDGKGNLQDLQIGKEMPTNKSILVCIAKKIRLQEFKWPSQGKY